MALFAPELLPQTVMTRLCDVRPLTNFSHVVTHSPGLPFRLHQTLPPIPSRPTSSGPDWIHYRLMARRDKIGEFGGITMHCRRRALDRDFHGRAQTIKM